MIHIMSHINAVNILFDINLLSTPNPSKLLSATFQQTYIFYMPGSRHTTSFSHINNVWQIMKPQIITFFLPPLTFSVHGPNIPLRALPTPSVCILPSGWETK
jgi:hypothetical protein